MYVCCYRNLQCVTALSVRYTKILYRNRVLQLKFNKYTFSVWKLSLKVHMQRTYIVTVNSIYSEVFIISTSEAAEKFYSSTNKCEKPFPFGPKTALIPDRLTSNSTLSLPFQNKKRKSFLRFGFADYCIDIWGQPEKVLLTHSDFNHTNVKVNA